MECYEGATMIKTFRGLMQDETQDTIVLHTNDGSTGYRVVKFELILYDPTADTSENVVKIWKVTQNTLTDKIDFADQTLLAAAYIEANSTDGYYPIEQTVIFDREIFNQDIYITNSAGGSASNGVNYYLELEQVKLDLDENTVATLKDIRNKELRTMIA
jgi:hypothetical protein